MKPWQQLLLAMFWYSSNKEASQQINYTAKKKLQDLKKNCEKIIIVVNKSRILEKNIVKFYYFYFFHQNDHTFKLVFLGNLE
jgi:hypothetical protein